MATPSLAELTRVFARIGCLSFGGPAGQIALMQRELVDERGWVEQGAFLRALNLCHLLPGPEAQQLATWIGWRLHGTRGGLIAGMLFVLPGAAVMLALSLLYVTAAGLHWFAALFLGIKAAVLAIVVQAVMRIGKRALGTQFKLGMALASFIALTVLGAPFPLVILGAAGIVIPLFARIRITPVIGFILVGVLVGPFGLGRLVVDTAAVALAPDNKPPSQLFDSV